MEYIAIRKTGYHTTNKFGDIAKGCMCKLIAADNFFNVIANNAESTI
jgi:hypothetical protein